MYYMTVVGHPNCHMTKQAVLILTIERQLITIYEKVCY